MRKILLKLSKKSLNQKIKKKNFSEQRKKYKDLLLIFITCQTLNQMSKTHPTFFISQCKDNLVRSNFFETPKVKIKHNLKTSINKKCCSRSSLWKTEKPAGNISRENSISIYIFFLFFFFFRFTWWKIFRKNSIHVDESIKLKQIHFLLILCSFYLYGFHFAKSLLMSFQIMEAENKED